MLEVALMSIRKVLRPEDTMLSVTLSHEQRPRGPADGTKTPKNSKLDILAREERTCQADEPEHLPDSSSKHGMSVCRRGLRR
eukprot:1360456-Prymnesium_polylepis.1